MSFSVDDRGRRDDRDHRAARATARLLAAGLFVAVLGAVVAFSVYTVRSDGGTDADTDGAAPAPTAVPDGATADGIGPPPGADLNAYLDAARAALGSARGEQAAVVSLRSYRTEADARKAVGELPVASLLVALPGGLPAVTSEPARWLEEQKAAQRAEREEIRKILPTVNDPAFKAFYNEELARLDKAIRSVPTDVVFGVVVRGAPPRLQALAASPDVRVVDVARASLAGEPRYRGVRPEETTVAGQPPTRPV